MNTSLIEGDIHAVADSFQVVDPSTLTVRSPFTDLFPIHQSVQDAIEKSMKRDGYDQSKPINIWRQEDIVIDGHTRRLVAIKLGTNVLICYHDFKDEDEALEYAIANQRDRRNLTDADIMRCVKVLDNRKKHGGDRRSDSFKTSGEVLKTDSASRTAEVIGTSKTKIDKSRFILDHADDETKQAVEKGQMSLNMAYNKTQAQRRGGTERRQNGRRSRPKNTPHPAVVAAGSKAPEKMPDPIIENLSPEDAKWLESLSLRAKVAPHKLDDDALIYRRLAPLFQQIKASIAELIGVRSTDKMSPLHYVLNRLVSIPPVETWTVCDKCGGSGIKRGVCRPCRGSGYEIPGL